MAKKKTESEFDAVKAIQRIKCQIENTVFKETPVDIITFLRKDDYLGKVTKNLRAIFPGWISVMESIFENNYKYLIVLTGAIGIGKTSVVCEYCLPYILYRLMLLRDPWGTFELGDSGKMDVTFFNLTRSLSGSRGFAYMQHALAQSPWFRDNGAVVLNRQTLEVSLPMFQWNLASPYSKGFGSIGGNIIAGVMDEVDSPNESEGQKKRVLQAYDATVRRFESRFVKDQMSLGRLFLVASKQDELSFLEVFIEEMKYSKKVKVFDKSQWDIKPASNYSGVKFKVQVGDAYTQPKILDTEDEVLKAQKDGNRIIEVPIEHRFEFERDIVGALRDLAGVSVRGIRKHKLFPAERFIADCMLDSIHNPVTVPNIEIGLEDDVNLMGFIDLDMLRMPLASPRCIHIDIAFSGDALGLASSGVVDWREMAIEAPDGTHTSQKMPVVETDIILRLQAREGDRIPLHRVRKLILDLKSIGLNIVLVTIDLRLASEDTLQLLQKAKITAEYMSVDKDLKPYMTFRDMVFERRWVCHRHERLFFELKHLELDRDKQKVDHPEKVKDLEFLADGTVRDIVLEGSKDLADAVVGSVYSAVLHAKHPVDVHKYIQQLQMLKEKTPIKEMPAGWFISEKSKEETLKGQEIMMVNGKATPDSVEKMKAALRKLKGHKF